MSKIKELYDMINRRDGSSKYEGKQYFQKSKIIYEWDKIHNGELPAYIEINLNVYNCMRDEVCDLREKYFEDFGGKSRYFFFLITGVENLRIYDRYREDEIKKENILCSDDLLYELKYAKSNNLEEVIGTPYDILKSKPL